MIRGLHPFRFQTGAHDRSAGFTLVELTLSIAMLVTLTMVLFGFLRTGMGLYRAGEGRRDVYERAQILLDHVVRVQLRQKSRQDDLAEQNRGLEEQSRRLQEALNHTHCGPCWASRHADG